MKASALLVGPHLGGHLAREPARRDGVHPHALAGPLDGQLAGEVDDRALRRGVARLLDRRRRHQPEDRRHVDDRARPLHEHLATDELAQQEQRVEVHVDHPAELVDGLVLGRHHVADAGVVHEHVDATEPLERGGDEGLEIGVDGDVARDRDRSGQPLDERFEPVEPTGRDHDGGPGRVQHLGEAHAQPARRAGDDGDLAVEPERPERIGQRMVDGNRSSGDESVVKVGLSGVLARRNGVRTSGSVEVSCVLVPSQSRSLRCGPYGRRSPQCVGRPGLPASHASQVRSDPVDPRVLCHLRCGSVRSTEERPSPGHAHHVPTPLTDHGPPPRDGPDRTSGRALLWLLRPHHRSPLHRPTRRRRRTNVGSSRMHSRGDAGAYTDFWHVWLKANNPPDPDDPELAEVATGSQLGPDAQLDRRSRQQTASASRDHGSDTARHSSRHCSVDARFRTVSRRRHW